MLRAAVNMKPGEERLGAVWEGFTGRFERSFKLQVFGSTSCNCAAGRNRHPLVPVMLQSVSMLFTTTNVN